MKAVAVHGKFRGYELKQADLTCPSLGDLSVYNLRRLFANRGWDFMEHKLENSVEGKDGNEMAKNEKLISSGTL